MDVRCERCKARYTVPDDRITPEGLAVRCSACGHAFKIRTRQQVVQQPATEAEATGAITLARFQPGLKELPAKAVEWTLRRADGSTQRVADLAAVQRLIAGRQAARSDELSKNGGSFQRLGEYPELGPMLLLIETTSLVAPKKARADASRPDAGRTDAAQTDAARTDAARTDAARTDAARTDAARPGRTQTATRPNARSADEIRSRRTMAAAIVAFLMALVIVVGVVVWSGSEPLRPPTSATSTATAGQPPAGPPAAEAGPTKGQPAKAPRANPPAGPPKPGPAAPQGAVAAPRPAQPVQPVPQALPTPARPPPTPTSADRAQAFRYRVAQARALREAGETARALDVFGRLVQEEPGNAAVLAGRGLCYFELNQFESAEASFKQALAAAPEDAEATMGLAETYRQTGRRADAVTLYKRYLAAHPTGDEAAVARNALSQLKE